MKKLFLFAAAAALLAACSSKDDLSTGQQPAAPSGDGSVAFDAYTGRAATRAGWAGELTTTQLKEAATPGFGVFGYYTDNNDYDQRATPNFFYNQKVYWETDKWLYTPVKYWPNEYGNSAVSDEADKVTYFAYAPWVDIIPSSGKVRNTATPPGDNTKELESYGITGMTKNTGTGDPLLKYIASFNSNKSVDLCWGVADNGDGLWPIVNDGSTMNIKNGTPWLNVLRPAGTDQKVKFTFKHATAQMRINIDAVVDDPAHGLTNPVADKTRIWVRQITFKGFALKGTLNLNNDDQVNKPNWLDYNGQNELVAEDVIVYDGRKDGKEGVAGAVATNEKVLGLNPAIIQDGVYEGIAVATNPYDNTEGIKVYGTKADGTKGDDNYLRRGVTDQKVNLFAQNTAEADINKSEAGSDAIFHVIPVDENFEIEIVYDVETVSENLAQNLSDGATKGTSIENRIRKSISFGNETKLQAGHSYKLDLHLGMNSVKFDAAMTDWIEEAAQDVDLPFNTPILGTAIDSPGANITKGSVPYDATSFFFGIDGFEAGETVTPSMADDTGKSNTASNTVGNGNLTSWNAGAAFNAMSNGIAVEQLTTTVNPTTSNRTQKITLTGAQSGKIANVTVTQQAHPIQIYAGANYGAANEVTWAAINTITLKSNISSTLAYGWMSAGLAKSCAVVTPSTDAADNPNGCGITVKRNGVALTWVAAAAVATTPKSFSFGDTSGEITLKDNIQVGDIYEITLKTGDAPAETITVKVVP